MDRETKKLLNSLKCPICSAQIDSITNKRYGYLYSCVANKDHYVLSIDDNTSICREKVHIYDNNHKYAIVKSFTKGVPQTEISVYETDLEHRVIFSFKKKQIFMDKELFDFTNFNVDKALKRIKTVFVFQ